MKNILFVFAFCACVSLTHAQVKVFTSGATKIGNTTTGPAAGSQLHIQGGNTVIQDGNLGIGTTNPLFDIQIVDPNNAAMVMQTPSPSGFASFQLSVNNRKWGFGARPLVQNHRFGLSHFDGTAWLGEVMTMDGVNMGIGRTNPSARLDVAGSIAINGTVMLTSDKNLKQNVKSFKSSLEDVMKLNPVTYQYNGKANSDTEATHIGLVAQELQKIRPEMVEEFDYKQDDMEGNIVEEGRYLRINDTAIKYLLVNAIKEQQAQIVQDQKEIQDLRTRLENLESVVERLAKDSQDISLESTSGVWIEQNNPNPFNGTTTINYNIPEGTQNAKIIFTDASGKLVKEVTVGGRGQGNLNIDANELPAGMYFYNLHVDNRTIEGKKMIKQN